MERNRLLKNISAVIGYPIALAIGIYSIWLLISQENSIADNMILYMTGGLFPFAVYTIARHTGWFRSRIYEKNKWTIPYIYALFVLTCILIYSSSEIIWLDCFNNATCYLFSYICIGYLIYACNIARNGIELDWHLIHGDFLNKTISLVLLMPFLLTTILMLFNIEAATSFSETEKTPQSLFWITFCYFTDPGNQETASPDIRLWTTLVTSLGILLLNGLMITSILSWIDRRKERWQNGEEPYTGILLKTPHYVIIGGCDVALGIVRQILKPDEKGKLPYIVIQTSGDIEQFRRELFSLLDNNEMQSIIVRYGSRTSHDDIEELCLTSAKEIYVLGEESRDDDIESYHDTLNMTCLRHIAEICGKAPSFLERREKLGICTSPDELKVTVHVMFEYQTTFNVFQITDLDDAGCVIFRPFNYYEMWAQNVLVNKDLRSGIISGYVPLEGRNGILQDDDFHVHMVIVGMSRMGTAMAIETAHMAHYPNFATKKRRTRITIIDSNMKQEMDFFMSRYKEMFSLARHRYVNSNNQANILTETAESRWKNPMSDPDSESPYKGNYLGEDFIDIEWEFIEGSIETSVIQQYLSDISADRNAKLTIAVCTPENNRAVATAIYLPESIYNSESTQQILVYQRYNKEIIENINSNDKYRGKLRAFGMATECYNRSLNSFADTITKHIDLAYKLYYLEKEAEIDINEILTQDIYSDIKELDGIGEEIESCKKHIELFKKALSQNDYAAKVSAFTELEESRKILEKEISKLSRKSGIGTIRSNGKAKSAMRWSSMYNVHSIWSKFRCIRNSDGTMFNPLTDNFTDGQLDILGAVEHNRWNTEQLLMHYRPLEREEQEEAKITGAECSGKKKKELKKAFKHLDICSNAVLDKIDYDMSSLDKALIRIIPYAYKEYINNKNNTEI